MIKQRVLVQNVVQMTNRMAFKEFHSDYIPIFVLEHKNLSSEFQMFFLLPKIFILHVERYTRSYTSTEVV